MTGTFAGFVMVCAATIIVLVAILLLAMLAGSKKEEEPTWTEKYVQNGVLDRRGERSVARRTSLK